jgi:hypothetical protein
VAALVLRLGIWGVAPPVLIVGGGGGGSDMSLIDASREGIVGMSPPRFEGALKRSPKEGLPDVIVLL